MRIAVTGKQGQVVSALIEVGPKLGVEILPVGRPELDLLSPETVQPALANIRPNIICERCRLYGRGPSRKGTGGGYGS